MKHKKLTISIVAIFGVLVLILLVAYAALRSPAFERYTIGKLVQSTN